MRKMISKSKIAENIIETVLEESEINGLCNSCWDIAEIFIDVKNREKLIETIKRMI